MTSRKTRKIIREEIANYFSAVPFVDDVEYFNKTFGKPNNYTPVIPEDEKLLNFVVDFIREETDELEQAINNRDIVEILDAICDILYVAVGNATMVFGLKDKLLKAFDEVQASNISKSCSSEEEALETVELRSKEHGECYYKKIGHRWIVYRKSDDKVMKSINYFAPNLKQFFSEDELNH